MRWPYRKILLASVTLVAVALFCTTLIRSTYLAPSDSQHAPTGLATSSLPVVVPEEQPSRLMIPTLSIDAIIQQVGLTKTGNLGIPNNFSDVAWYKYGTVPGQKGNAIIDGHVDNALALAGVFKHLDTIKTGDTIYVQTVNGNLLHFVVDSINSYPYEAVPMQQLLDEKDVPRLTLITCIGTWVQKEKSYDQRLVVSAKLIS